MRQLFSKAFWIAVDAQTWQAAFGILIVTVIWALLSMGLDYFEGSRSYFEIRAVLQFKIILATVIFLGRYLLFANYRQPKWFGWLWGLVFLISMGAQGQSMWEPLLNWVYLILRICDTVVWGFFVTLFLEFFGTLFYFWSHFPPINSSMLDQFWQKGWREIIAAGILLTLLTGLFYYYLTSFYLVNMLFYSYVLLLPVLATGLGLYLILSLKVNNWLQQDLNLLDQEISIYLQWQQFKNNPGFDQKYQWLEYLIRIRNYLCQMGRTRLSWKVVGSYLIFVGFILALPYIFGLVIEVGSFK